MWAWVDESAPDIVERLQVGAAPEQTAVYALILDLRDATLAADDIMPVPGCHRQSGGHGRYWLTGTIGDDIRYLKKSKHLREPSFRFLLTVGNLRFIGKLIASRRQVKIRPGSRVTVTCVLAVPHDRERQADVLPAEWRSAWRVRRNATGGQPGDMLDLEPPDDDSNNGAGLGRRTRLLLDTDYGGGPLWCRSHDNKAPWGLGLDYFPLTKALHDRLVTWTAEDYHLHDDYEDDDPQHETAWHDEGLALLADLRTELGLDYDIKFSHELDA